MAEVDDAGRGNLRFSAGDQPSGPVVASYQVGQGAAGNVPAEAINAVVALTPAAATTLSVVQSLGNPLPAVGGTDPESITAGQGRPARRLPGRPAARSGSSRLHRDRRTGSRGAQRRHRAALDGDGYAADVAVQPAAGEDPGQELLAAVYDVLWPLRRIGHELWVRPPSYRPLMIALNVDVGADVVRADATAALTALLGSGQQADGTPGLFSPQRMGFGQPVYASPIVAAAQGVPGVEAVTLTRFGFLGPARCARLGPDTRGPAPAPERDRPPGQRPASAGARLRRHQPAGWPMSDPTPVTPPAGLPALPYSPGDRQQFLAQMLAALARTDATGGQPFGLRTRALDDPTVALLDAWATVADVIAFYQERIANEGYLRTATQPGSLLAIAQLVGYRPRPGLAASVWLAYSLQPDPADTAVVLPAGLLAQSVPGTGELPQTFETTGADSWPGRAGTPSACAPPARSPRRTGPRS